MSRATGKTVIFAVGAGEIIFQFVTAEHMHGTFHRHRYVEAVQAGHSNDIPASANVWEVHPPRPGECDAFCQRMFGAKLE